MADAWLISEFTEGRKMRKVVPFLDGLIAERNRIVPPCFSISCLVTHRPRPVPVLPFVV